MILLSFGVLFLLVIASQFFTPILVEIGLWLSLLIILLLPTFLLSSFYLRSNQVNVTPSTSLPILNKNSFSKYFITQAIYLLGLGILLSGVKGLTFMATPGFWVTFIQYYDFGYLVKTFHDLLVANRASSIVVFVIPSILATIALVWHLILFVLLTSRKRRLVVQKT